MKNFILIVSAILLFACSAQQHKQNKVVSEKKEGRKIHGFVSKEYLSETINQNLVQKPKLSLKIEGEYYFIKIANPEISEQDLEGMMGKKIGVRGELVGEGYGGEIPAPTAKGKATNESRTNSSVGHILIYELLPEKK